MTVPAHLHAAGQALCAIARQRHPDQAWIARVENLQGNDPHRLSGTPCRQPVVAAGTDQLHAVANHDGRAAPGAQ